MTYHSQTLSDYCVGNINSPDPYSKNPQLFTLTDNFHGNNKDFLFFVSSDSSSFVLRQNNS